MAEKIIDVAQAIRISKSGFVRSLPRFAVRLIEKIIHQDEMNDTINRNIEKKGIEFVNAILREWNVDVLVDGSENIPSSGKFVFVANHPAGGMDALAFLSMIGRYFPEVVSPSNDLFNYIPNLQPLILGINVFGKNTKEVAAKINELFESDSQIMIFPAGEVSRRKRGVISDPPWQKTFITKAVAARRDIIPVYISGRNSSLFYNMARLRTLLGIKLYIETFLLPHEMMKQRNAPIHMIVGKPVPWQTFTDGKSHGEWASHMKEMVYNLPLQRKQNHSL